MQKDNETFQKELSPPTIQVTESEGEEIMETEDIDVPLNRTGTPVAGTDGHRALNPFLNREESRQVPEEDLLDITTPREPMETNPFRRLNREG